MKGSEILRLISLDRITSSYFGGIFSIDQLTFSIPNRDIYFICNTDFYKNKGKHWVVIFLQKNSKYIEYFDSLGKRPSKRFVDFMSQSGKSILCNIKRFQSKLSYACGYYCLYFIYLRCRYNDFYSIVNNFSSNLNKNEKYVIDYVNHSYKLKRQ